MGSEHTAGVALNIPLNNACLSHVTESVNISDENSRIIHGIIHWSGLKILLVNIYAPSGESAQVRASFFECINDLLDRAKESHIILAGDFNCVLNNATDRLNYQGSLTSRTPDQIELEKLITRHNLIDAWRYKNEHSTECTFGRKGHKISRIDQIYISDNIKNLVHDATIIKCSISDHNPVKISLRTPNNTLIARSKWKLNTTVLNHRKYQSIIKDTITTHKNELQNKDPIETIRCYERMKASIVRQSRRYNIGHEHNVQDRIKTINDLIQNEITHPNEDAETSKQLLAHYYSQLEDQLNTQYKISALNSRTTSSDTTERMTKEFFQSIKPQTRGEMILSIKNSSGQIVRIQNDISEAICEFYENLYCFKEVQQTSVDILLSNITTQVSANDSNKMNAKITSAEVIKAINDIANEKAPGPDGLGLKAEFYKTFSQDLGEILALVFNNCIDNGTLPNSISNATIKLLFKKGDRNEIGNWRPISLLNVDYKILAKIITERMKSCLPKILHPDQKGFVPSRRLEDAVIKTRCLIEYCQSHNNPSYMILWG